MNEFIIKDGILEKYNGSDSAVNIPDGVTEIAPNAFSECPSITKVTVPQGVTVIGNQAFMRCNMLYSIRLPDSLERIDEYAFSGCEAMKRLCIPASVKYIGKRAFSGCGSLREITVSEENPAYRSIDGSLYTGDGKRLIAYAVGKTDKIFTVPPHVTAIGEGALRGCRSLTEVIVSDTVTGIEKEALAECASLIRLRLPDRLSVISPYAFSKCVSLKEAEIPDGVTDIGDGAFFGCSSLESFTIPDSVETISPSAFEQCTAVKEIFYGRKRAYWFKNMHKKHLTAGIWGWLTGKGHREFTEDEEDRLYRYVVESIDTLKECYTDDVGAIRFMTARGILCASAADTLLESSENAEIRALLLDYLGKYRARDGFGEFELN